MAAAFGGTTSIVDFAVQGMGEPLEKARDTWLNKARGKAAIDYGLHIIVRDVTDKVLKEMDVMVKEGISSFKLFMAYPGVFQVDDGSIFKAISRTAENGGLICMHAENGGVIDVLVKRALAAKHTEPKWHALTRPPEAEGKPQIAPSASPRWRAAFRSTSFTCPHRRRSSRSGSSATAGFRHTRRRAPNTSSCPSTTTTSPASTARST